MLTTGHTSSRVTIGRGADRRVPPTAKKKVEFSTTQVRGVDPRISECRSLEGSISQPL